MKTWQAILFGVFLGLLFSAVLLLIISPPHGKAIELAPLPTQAPIIIYITGSVKNPGVYSLSRQSRLGDAVIAAGGFLNDADQSAVNLAAKILDGQRIMVPKINLSVGGNQGQVPPTDLSTPKPEVILPSNENPLNLNTATLEEIDLLPGIGPARAAEILAYRTQKGSFTTIEELMNISGIGQATFDRIKALIYVDTNP
jgi:competence protein ComEA